jgi:hypothetical protein
MSLLAKAAYRLLYAMEEEERSWEVFKSPFGNGWTATDSCRIRRWPGSSARPIPDLIPHATFSTQGAAEHFVRWYCIKVAIVYTLCFWRKKL